jgi:hypothetical protein
MQDLATYTAEVITGISTLIAKFKSLPGVDKYITEIWPEILKRSMFGQLGEFFRRFGKEAVPAGMGGYPSSALGGTFVDPNDAARKKAEAAAAKRAKDLAAANAKSAKAEKAKLALTKAAAVFDSTRVSLAAALRATYDKETKLRLEALMLIEEDKGEAALKKIDELAKFQKNADMQRLAGVEEISNATLQSLNTQLLTELKVINDSKMAEGNKELAREEAFKKYNAAITAAGSLMAKEAYSERVQIQLTEIARLASLSNTYNAAKTNSLLLESAELSMIDRVAKAQALADDARLKALKEYAAALGGIGSSAPKEFIPNFKPYLTTPPSTTMGPFAPTITEMPKLIDPNAGVTYNPTQNADRNYDITIQAGIGDPEAIARAVEDVLNQSTYRGTSVNRGSGRYYE